MKFLEAKDRSLSQVLVDNRFRIDSFQREYRWQRKHIEALISDLASSFDKNYKEGDTIETYSDYGSYYMGPIVLCDDQKELSIVDGQQRLSSFTLILIFLHHAQNFLGIENNFKVDIEKYLYVRKGGKNTLILNVASRITVIEHLINNPDHIFSEIDDLDHESLSIKNSTDESIPNIIERYEDITKLFPENLKTKEKLPIFIEWLLNNVILVEIKAFNMESAYTIFETMNDRGMSLNPTEILKGYLLSMIEDDIKSDEMNNFWRERIFEIKSILGIDSDLDFFRNWLRAKYAESRRSSSKGSESEDFELIGTQFHSWVKNNSSRLYLKKSEDYYFFIRSDFDFFSNLYISINSFKTRFDEFFASLYISNFYTIADSLAYPLYLSPISKVDDDEIIDSKIRIVNNFIDVYTVQRTFQGRTITQSSIRNSIYELIKEIRNLDLTELKNVLKNELDKFSEGSSLSFNVLHSLDNWGFYHYFYARILYYMQVDKQNFEDLLRSRKQSSYVLHQICTIDDVADDFQDSFYFARLNSVANYILIRRYDLNNFNALLLEEKLPFLLENNYLPEICEINPNEHIFNFIEQRDLALRELVNQIWNFEYK